MNLKYISVKAAQFGMPIFGGASGIGLTLDSLLRSKNETELGSGIAALAIGVIGAACFKKLGEIADKYSARPHSTHSTYSSLPRGSSPWPDENWGGTPSDEVSSGDYSNSIYD